MKTRSLRAAVLLIVTLLLCICANLLAFTIDTPEMRQHVQQGCSMLGYQQASPQPIGGFLSAQLDNFTAILQLKTAGYIGEEPLLHKAFAGYRVDMNLQEGFDGWDGHATYASGTESPTGGGMPYMRYWHGYTLPLRLLLCFLDLANLQMVLYFVQMSLMIAVLLAMDKAGLRALIPAFFLSYFLQMPFALGICLQYAPISLLMLVGCLGVLCLEKPISSSIGMPAYFAWLGLMSNYLDLLTFPMVTLGFPLILLLGIRLHRGDSLCSLTLLTCLCGFSWGLGYGGMWALKWLLNAGIFGSNSLSIVFSQIGLRASDNQGSLSRTHVLLQNFRIVLAKKGYLVLIGATFVFLFVRTIQNIRFQKSHVWNSRAVVLLLPALAPCLWVLLLANHSSDHTYFTYRTLTVAFFGLLAFFTFVIQRREVQS